MIIKPSAAIRNNYNEISALCKERCEPIFLTKNGEGDLVIINMVTFSCRESMLRIREQLPAVEEDRLAGKTGVTVEQLDDMLKKTIAEASDGQLRS